MTFYERLDWICKDRGLSVSALVQALGMSSTAGATWKRRGTMPKLDVLQKICSLLDVAMYWFACDNDEFLYGMSYGIPRESEVDEDGELKTTQKKTATNSDGLDEQLLNLLRQVPADKVQRVKDFVSGLIET